MKTEWNLGLLYKNEKDPQIEKDITILEQAHEAFEKKYKNKDFVSSVKKLAEALESYIALQDSTLAKPWWYFALRASLNGEDKIASAFGTKMQDRMNKAGNKVAFFMLEIGKISPSLQKEYLKDTRLAQYHYYLKTVFDQSKFNLTEKEEQLASLLSTSSYQMWVDGQQRATGQLTVTFKDEEIPLTKAFKMVSELPKEERRELHSLVVAEQKANSVFAEAELNAICNYKKIMDELRGYKKSYSSTLLANENDEKTIEDLVSVVTRYFTLSERFYKIHAKLLGEKKITRADRMVRIGKINTSFTFDDTVEIVKKAFAKVDPKYADIVQTFVDNRQVDIYPKKGKQGGAYCWGMGNLPIYVLLNHTNDIDSVETFAHEMGHAIHGMLDKNQPLQYRGHSTATAEVASLFFEQLVSSEIAPLLSEEEQIILLHGNLMGDITGIFAQIAGFNYEVELHENIRAKGQLSREEIASLLQKHLQSFSGSTVVTTQDDGYHFVSWWHTRMFFYVYSYAYGQLISRALFEKWKADHSYGKKVEQFLSAGRSMSPKDIFKSIGINTNEAFFEAGLKGIERDIDKLEKLSKNWLKKQKKA